MRFALQHHIVRSRKFIMKLALVSTLALTLGLGMPAFAQNAETPQAIPTPPQPPVSQPQAEGTDNTGTQAQDTEQPTTGQPSGTAAEVQDPNEDDQTCSTASLVGNYGIQIQGLRIINKKGYTFNSVRTATFDGQGKTSGQGMANFNGRIVPIAVEGTYTVDDDCSVQIDAVLKFADGSKLEYKQFGVVVNGGDAVMVMQLAGGRNATGRYEKY